MANIKSQKKRILTNEKAPVANKAVRSELKPPPKPALRPPGPPPGPSPPTAPDRRPTPQPQAQLPGRRYDASLMRWHPLVPNLAHRAVMAHRRVTKH